MQQTVTGREVVDALEARGCVFQHDSRDNTFGVQAPPDFDRGDKLLELLNTHADEIGKYLMARSEHVCRLLVLPEHRTKH